MSSLDPFGPLGGLWEHSLTFWSTSNLMFLVEFWSKIFIFNSLINNHSESDYFRFFDHFVHSHRLKSIKKGSTSTSMSNFGTILTKIDNFQTWRRPTFWGLQISSQTFVVRFVFRFQTNSSQCRILLPPSMGDTIRKICFDSIGPYNAFGPIQSSQSNFLLFPIQSNRPDSIRFGPIRSDSFRFRIRYDAFGPIQILWIRQK